MFALQNYDLAENNGGGHSVETSGTLLGIIISFILTYFYDNL